MYISNAPLSDRYKLIQRQIVSEEVLVRTQPPGGGGGGEGRSLDLKLYRNTVTDLLKDKLSQRSY